MHRQFIRILLSLLLTFAVTNYVWIQLFQQDPIVAELEPEEERESKEELREGRFLEEMKEDPIQGDAIFPSAPIAFHTICTGFVKHGNSFNPLVHSCSPRLYLLFRQLRLPC